jgi:hypothetical protein
LGAQAQVLKALTRKFILADDVDLATLAHNLPAQCTGADMYGLCADAWMHALRRVISELASSGRTASNTDEAQDLDDVEVATTMSDFVEAFENLVPSLTMSDLVRYDKLEEQYRPSKRQADSSRAGISPAIRGGNGALPDGVSASEQPAVGMEAGKAAKGLGARPMLPARKKKVLRDGAQGPHASLGAGEVAEALRAEV